ncbi:PTS sugar transporter subunit IIC [Exiguobacterium aestuarii]|uniref:PTS sugar transporter subunit IIC n=1 Tax=Exiguobacterium aestuarii TaxID=273527 RepID=A0ABW2PKF5_9BACL|nr:MULTISPECIES: PTS sugar transporter subunit IIC [Exiguobacterium]MCT4787007.1 PTS sugar transporter subunit IIC [Exiguobacterium aestuarii]
MVIIQGIALLLLILALFTLFSYKAPYGMKAMGALAGAAIASFLVEAFNAYAIGGLLPLPLYEEVGQAAGSLSGPAAAALVAIALGINPVYSLMIGLSVSGFGILPGFFAGYILALVGTRINRYLPTGVDMIFYVIVMAPLARLVATGVDPLVSNTLAQIGAVIELAATQNPVVMGLVLGGIVTVVSTSPLSSMALTAMLGLTGVPMAIAALALTASISMNYLLFRQLKIGTKKDQLSVAIEPLTQADLISANPIPIYSVNFVGGAIAGLIVAMTGMINDAPGSAAGIPGLLVMYGFNDWQTVTLTAVVLFILGIGFGLIGSRLFKNFPIVRHTEKVESTEEDAA